MTRILVTGGAGYIGSHTVRLLLAHGHDVQVYDNLSTGHRSAVPPDRLIIGDLCDTDRLDQTILQQRTEAVIHFAASAYVGESVENPAKYYLNNVVNTLHLLERMRRHQVSRIVFSSTVATFGIPPACPVTEQMPQVPINPYGRTKLMIEQALRDYRHAYGLGFAALRYFNAAGADPSAQIGEDHQPETHLIPIVLQVALGKRPFLTINGTDYPTADGTCIRDYVHVNDLADAHVLALDHLQPGAEMCYHLGTGRGHSIQAVLQAAEQVTGKSIPFREGPRRIGDPAQLVASAERIQQELGWQPRYTDIHAIIETAWNWHLRNPDGFAR